MTDTDNSIFTEAIEKAFNNQKRFGTPVKNELAILDEDKPIEEQDESTLRALQKAVSRNRFLSFITSPINMTNKQK